MTDHTPDPIDIAVGERIRARRRHLGMSQTVLAHALGVTFQQVQKYEKGKNRISASMMVRAAAAMETTGSYLLGEAGTVTSVPTDSATRRLVSAFVRINDPIARAAIIATACAAAQGRSMSVNIQRGPIDAGTRRHTEVLRS